jgi:hypothetical protein
MSLFAIYSYDTDPKGAVRIAIDEARDKAEDVISAATPVRGPFQLFVTLMNIPDLARGRDRPRSRCCFSVTSSGSGGSGRGPPGIPRREGSLPRSCLSTMNGLKRSGFGTSRILT